MLPDFERADRIGEFWGYPESRTFAELLIDCEEDRTLRAVLVGMLREASARAKACPSPRFTKLVRIASLTTRAHRADHRAMSVSRKPVVAALAAGLLLLAGPHAGAQAAWSQIPSPNSPGSNELLGAAASDAANVWAVGRVVSGSNPSTFRSLVLRWNGNTWSSVAHPHFSTNHVLQGVDAPAANDAWAVGSRWVTSGGVRTLIQHWDGVRWSVVRSPNPNRGGINQLHAVKAVPSDPQTVWAVGSYDNAATPYGDLTLVLRRSGDVWRAVPSPNVTVDNHLEAVDASGPSDAWAVGWGSTSQFGGAAIAIVLHWNGTTWENVTIPQPSQVMLFGVRAVAPNDVWAVGHTYVGGPHWIPVILHWDGVSWSRAMIPVPEFGGQLRDVVSLSATNVYAIGFSGESGFAGTLVLHWDGTSWTTEPTPSPQSSPKLYGGAAIAPSTVWAAGYRYRPSLLANQTLTLRTTNG